MGCILALDMTIECIFAKLSYLFGKVSSHITLNGFLKGYSVHKVKKMFMKNLRGELTDTKSHEKFSLSNNKMVSAIANSLKVKDQDSISQINNVITPVLINSLVSTVSDPTKMTLTVVEP